MLALYLSGVYHQGTGDLSKAMSIFRDSRFLVDHTTQRARCNRLGVSLLATLNALWIMQHPKYQDVAESTRLLDSIRPLCQDHLDVEIRIAFNLVLATITIQPPQSLQQAKSSMHLSLNGSKAAGNTHCLAIALCIMRSRLFENVVGEQALKSARAASAQAKRSGNLLWMSVADGMLAQSMEAQGHFGESRSTRDSAAAYAARALAVDQTNAASKE
jgi:hypothetical protein